MTIISYPSFAAAFRNRRVLITGHTGFKGSWLALWMEHLGAKVIGYSLDPPSQPNLFESIELKNRITHIHGDITEYNSVCDMVSEYQPEIIFHLAAQSLVRTSYTDTVRTYGTNVMGTVHVLEAARRTPSVRAVVIVTSDKCYENKEWVWGYRENDPMGGYDPYSSSKGCAELVTSAYIRSFFPGEGFGKQHQTLVASARAGNVIGGGDWGTDRLLPDCVRYLSRGERIPIRYPKAIRPWQHVLEPLSGYILLGAGLLGGNTSLSGAWNFGPVDGDIWSVERVVTEVIRLWGSGGYEAENQDQPHESHFLRLDCSKAVFQLGWTPKFSVQEALTATVDWYSRYYSGMSKEELIAFTLNQIEQYEQS